MKRLWILLVIALCFTLCACPAMEAQPEQETKQVHISAGKIEPGMTAKDVFVEVTIDHQPVACRVQLTCFTPTGYYEMEADEPVPDPFYVRLDVFYSLPKGCDEDDINVVMECDGGEYDGTGSVGEDDNGCVEAWSHAFYGELPEEETTQPQQETTLPEVETTAPHTHEWVEENNDSFYVSCTNPSIKTFVCSCGESKEETVPAPGHDLKEGKLYPPTCTENGSQAKSCRRCGIELLDTIPATGHAWSGWEKSTGLVHKRICSVCGAEETANHNIPSGKVTCTDCGEDIVN